MSSKLAFWQIEALLKGRKPLPNEPRQRPWLDKDFKLEDYLDEESEVGENGGEGAEAEEPHAKKRISRPSMPKSTSSRGSTSKNSKKAGDPWSDKEIRDLVRLKVERKSEREIARHFPHRTPLAIRKAVWKYGVRDEARKQRLTAFNAGQSR